jgi:uncharacterized protein YkwD
MKSFRKVWVLMIVLLIVGAIFGLSACKKSAEGGIADDAAFRSKPKAAPSIYIDPGVISRGNSAWQGQNYINAARAAHGLINQQRVNAGLGELRWDDNLAACAMVRATELPSSFSHTRPDGSDWYTVCPDLMYGENLAYGYRTPEEAMNSWMSSPEHKQNILTPGFTSSGVGVYEVNNTWYWNQEFGYY